jgi:hypothetical protein
MIGSTAGNIAAIDALFHTQRDCEPHGDPMDYSQPTDIASGARLGLGWLEQVWHWDFLSETFRNSLAAYANTTVYVHTRMNSGSFGYYTATLLWPEKEPEHVADRVLDLSITLRNLIGYTP